MQGLLEILFPFSSYIVLVIRVTMGMNFLLGRGIRQLIRQRSETIQRWRERGIPDWGTYMAAILNFVGALFLIVGLIVPIVAVFIAIEMIVTAIAQKRKLRVHYFGHSNAGYEINILYLLINLPSFDILWGGSTFLRFFDWSLIAVMWRWSLQLTNC